MSCDNTLETTSIVLWKTAVTASENQIHCLMKHQWQHMEIYPLLIKCPMTRHGKQHPLFFNSKQWQHIENHIHCMVKQQWQHMEVHPLLIKCAMRTHGKLQPLLFDRDQWQNVENYMHCKAKQHWQHMKILPLLFKCPATTRKTTSIVLWKRAVTTNKKSHPLHDETTVTTYRNPSTAN